MATRVRSYSKINLGLRIGPVQPDGFHALATLYQTLALHDRVTVEARPISDVRDAGRAAGNEMDVPVGRSTNAGILHSAQNDKRDDSGGSRITLTTNDARVPVDGRNTAWKMVERALTRMGVAAEVAIHIEKRLPVQGGMGAGSANAAAALIGLERELGVRLPEAERLELAAEVGSDVPLFLVGGAVLGAGRGEVVSAMEDLPATWCVVAVPEVGVSTPQAFRDWDASARGRGRGEVEGPGLKPATSESVYRGLKPAATPVSGWLTSVPQPDRLEELSHAYVSVLGVSQPDHGPDPSGTVRGFDMSSFDIRSSTQDGLAGNTLLALVRTGIENDFEQVVFPQYPLLREIKRLLMGTTAGVSSGDGLKGDSADASGGSVYAALSGSGSALFGLYSTEADAVAAQQRVQALGCKAILTETLPRQEYWRRMFAE